MKPTDPQLSDMRWISPGSFLMGSDHHYREEAPARRTAVSGFWIDVHPVTNAEFARFVAATDYVTTAERPPDTAPGRLHPLAPASAVFHRTSYRVDLRNPYNWWCFVPGADWSHPRGPGSSIEGLDGHPVVHVTQEDAHAYAAWADKDLPTEAEWEFAARGGLDAMEFAWGDTLMPDDVHMANLWQGEFPHENLCADGYEWTSPVGTFPPNGYGLYDMIGNVWEWTRDWYADSLNLPACCTPQPNRDGPHEFEPAHAGAHAPRKVLKGGSFLCAPNYCRRFRPAARMAQPINAAACNVGFRCVSRSS